MASEKKEMDCWEESRVQEMISKRYYCTWIVNIGSLCF